MASLDVLLPPPDQINDTHKVYSVAVAVGVMAGVTTFIVLWRLYSRFMTRSYGLDDWTIIPALCIIGGTWLYPAMSMAIRTSILLFYQRMFSTPGSKFKIVVQGLLVLQVIYLIVFAITPIFICRPLYKAWDIIERHLYMDDFYYYYMSVALYSVSMVFDAILLFLPLWPISKLQMPLGRRAGVAVLLIMGAGSTVCAAYKLAVFVLEMARYDMIDKTWFDYELSRLIPPQFDHYGVTYWIPSQVEPTVALIGASLPGLRQGVGRVWGTVSAYRSRNSSNRGTKTGATVDRTALGTWKSQAPKTDTRVFYNETESETALHKKDNYIPLGEYGPEHGPEHGPEQSRV
ncbi:hypothetical protein B0T17DRAFT_613471 [Bombardia bombarda]|uniref:Rhodopsin domain-containing protein n=1 Tax=Bombardia bombarda TaxID=252184 RepID=A0AA39XMS0_9PEZI|nr:hypothetical protein B0T17DRAFT_613471 [Bombardia bombarda]